MAYQQEGIKMTSRIAFISTGEKYGFYTLRTIVATETACVENYIKNLSTNWDTAQDKARVFADRAGMELHAGYFELDEIGKLRGDDRWAMELELINPDFIPYGKFRGQRLSNVFADDVDYFWWMLEDFNHTLSANIPFGVHLACTIADETDGVRPLTQAEKYEQQRVAEAAAADPVPVTDARINITGEILCIKSQDSFYGTVLKMLVRAPQGFKVWGSYPMSLDANKGDTISFIAKVDVSDKDDKFGFFKRPTKAIIVSKAV